MTYHRSQIETLSNVASPVSIQHYGERTNTGWLGIRIMCQSGVTCLTTTVVSVS